MIESVANMLSWIGSKKAETVNLKFGSVSVDIDSRVYDKIKFLSYIQSTEFNLKLAEKDGIKPLSLKEISEQIDSDTLGKAVLFDTPSVLPGNHWRVVEVDKEKASAILQLCGNFGNYDYSMIPPVNIPLDTPMFTGISIQEYELNGSSVSLKEVVEVVGDILGTPGPLNYPESLKHRGETILWSNSNGELR